MTFATMLAVIGREEPGTPQPKFPTDRWMLCCVISGHSHYCADTIEEATRYCRKHADCGERWQVWSVWCSYRWEVEQVEFRDGTMRPDWVLHGDETPGTILKEGTGGR